MTDKLKQVIVMRTDLNCRKGKMIAQGAHAAMAFMSRHLDINGPESDGMSKAHLSLTEGQVLWLENSFTKIVVGVDSEEELLNIHQLAQANGIASYIVTDNGATEFHGIPTKTCLALGPDYSSRLDPITGELRLL